MQLSIVMPTNRKGLLACSRIAQACSWAAPNVEVIIRDNSGDAQKRVLLSLFQSDHSNIVIADPCDSVTNFVEALELAKGEFVFTLADDDICFDRAVASLSVAIEQIGKDASVVGLTGSYVVETSQGSSIINYQNIDSDDAVRRVAGYLSFWGANVLYYAPIRRKMLQRVFSFMRSMPGLFSFHDQIICLLYLLNGKFVKLDRLMYLYDVGAWEESAQKIDVKSYVEAGLDPAINALHWFLCGFEGAVLVRNADLFPDYSLAHRQTIADYWFSTMFLRFKSGARLTFDSRFASDAERLRAKLLLSAGRLSFQDLLKEISDFMMLFSADKAQSYYEFWDAVINKRKPPFRNVDISAGADLRINDSSKIA
jgi:hypothetical protein